MPQRHPLLYDVERWRQWRFRLLGLAAVSLVTVALTTLRPASGNATIVQLYSLLAAFLLALALMFWLRARGSYIAVDDDELLIRVAVSGRQRVPLSEVRRARLVKLRAFFDKPEMKRLQPRPYRKWEDRDALVLRVEGDAVDLVRLRRLLGAKCVLGNDLVVPVAGGAELLAEIEAVISPRRQPPPGGGSRRRKRR
jgi:hypothetical protein